jgi:hypothetical protein
VQLNLTTYRKRQPYSASSKWQRPLYVGTAARAASTVQLRTERLQLVAVPVWRSGATTLQQLLGAYRQCPPLRVFLAGQGTGSVRLDRVIYSWGRMSWLVAWQRTQSR